MWLSHSRRFRAAPPCKLRNRPRCSRTSFRRVPRAAATPGVSCRAPRPGRPPSGHSGGGGSWNSRWFSCVSRASFQDLEEGSRANLVQRQTRRERFLFRDGAAGDATEEEAEQALAGSRVIEDVAEKRGERGFIDECFQAR